MAIKELPSMGVYAHYPIYKLVISAQYHWSNVAFGSILTLLQYFKLI
jgi:hypothetical protein